MLSASTTSPTRCEKPLNIIDDFLTDLDAQWTGPTNTNITLRLLGSTALFLQTTYRRGTKDSDVIETSQITP